MTAPPDSPDSAEEQALARAVAYRFLAACYRYPDAATAAACHALGEGVPAALAGLAGQALPGTFADLHQGLAACSPAEREAAYAALFGHSVQGTCPPYESEYADRERGAFQQPHELGDLAAFYRAFGLQLARWAMERLDHIALECEFMSFLCQKQAYAAGRGDGELLACCADAQKKFLAAHLGRWAPAFTGRLAHCAGPGPYAHLARFTEAFVSSECRLYGLPPGPEGLRLSAPSLDPDFCNACPAAASCPQIVYGANPAREP